MSKKVLGKGLGALIGPNAAIPSLPEKGENGRKVAIHLIHPSPLQPRKEFREEDLQELTDSIRSIGVLQPLIVRRSGNKYELIAGERRWRASQRAGLTEVPILIREATDEQVLSWAMVENLQRADLNPIEEAEGYALLLEQFNWTQEQVATQVGKSRASVANALRLRQLAPTVQDLVRKNHLSTGHAKVILSLSSHEEQRLLAEQALHKNLTVRQVEKLVAGMQNKSNKNTSKTKKNVSHTADWRDLELSLQRALGTRSRIIGTTEKGHIEIEFYSASDLERLLGQFGVKLSE